ncbi:hypothetical protein A3A09_03545 [Candidatus Nomurabacteria bacterium RIFCSPLOWO2_01_FULL_42_20]|nr:MAG: hypothetical protein A3A09_03545 [Candidatus Nomurabacteria bacterium RIFCSPLOWO2_01_FULL_42_20]
MKLIKNKENYRILTNCLYVFMIAIIPAFMTSAIWFTLHHWNILSVKHAYVIVLIANGLLGGAYFFLFKDAFGEVHKYYRQVNSFVEGNRVMFERYHDYKKGAEKFADKKEEEDKFLDDMRKIKSQYLSLFNGRLSLYFHTQMALISFFMVASFFARNYEDWMEGVAWIFILTYIMSSLFIMSKVMENPIRGHFRTKNVFLEWLEDEI